MTYTMDVVYAYDGLFHHYDHYENVPWSVVRQFLGNDGKIGLWTRKIYINGEEVSE